MKNDTLKGFCALVVTYVTLLVFSVSFVNADVLIDIDLTDDELGELKSIPNTGTLGGTFEAEVDTPSVTEVDGIKALTLDGTNDWYQIASPATGHSSFDFNGIAEGLSESVSSGTVPIWACLLYTSPSPRDVEEARMPSSA